MSARPTLVLAAGAALAGVLARGSAAQDAEPKLAPEPAIHQLGSLYQGDVRQEKFTLRNIDDRAVEIVQVRPTCGCTVASVKKSGSSVAADPAATLLGTATLVTLEPGETAEVEFEFRSAGVAAHHFSKRILVFLKGQPDAPVQLPIEGEVKQAVVVAPASLAFGDVPRGEARTLRAELRIVAPIELRVTEVGNAADFVRATIAPLDPSAGTGYAVDVTLGADAPVGRFSRTLALKTDHPRLAQFQLPIFANVLSDVRFDLHNPFNADLLDFGTTAKGAAASRVIDVVNGRPEVPYRVTEVAVEGKFAAHFEAAVATLEDGVRYAITLTSDGKLGTEFFNGRVVVRADHPDLKERVLAFSGWVK